MQTNERMQMYGFLAENFLMIPRSELAQNVLNGGLEKTLQSLLKTKNREISEGIRHIQNFAKESNTSVDEVLRQIGVDRVKLLRGISRRYSPLPPYESLYRGEQRHMGNSTQGVLQMYLEAGFNSANFQSELPDYIGVELNFMKYLCEKALQSESSGNRQATVASLQSQKSFLAEHLLRWVPDFCLTMEKTAKTEFYRGVSKLLLGFLSLEAEQIAGTKLKR